MRYIYIFLDISILMYIEELLVIIQEELRQFPSQLTTFGMKEGIEPIYKLNSSDENFKGHLKYRQIFIYCIENTHILFLGHMFIMFWGYMFILILFLCSLKRL
ncbi:hypothetical protein ACJX0J_036947 [Zea mays]